MLIKFLAALSGKDYSILVLKEKNLEFASRPSVRYLNEHLVKFLYRTCLIGQGISWTDNYPQKGVQTIPTREYHYDA